MNSYSLFDSTPARWGTDSTRWRKYNNGILPMWVADMDFDLAQPIQEAISKRARDYPFWYAGPSELQTQTLCDSLNNRYQWRIEKDWIVWIPGVMTGVYQTIAGLPENAKILVPTPVYGPLTRAAQLRTALPVELTLDNNNGNWQWNLPEMPEENTKALILCHPHNPCGKVFTGKELESIADYASKHNLLVISNEIHGDLTLDGSHIPFASICDDFKDNTVTCMSAGKTFNLAGLNTAFAIVPNKSLRNKLIEKLKYCGEVNQLGVLATITAYTQCDNWHKQLLDYLRANRSFIDEAISNHPLVDWIPNQAMFLAWINCSKLPQDFHARLIKAGLALSHGSDFGNSQYLRLNYAAPYSRLKRALEILTHTAATAVP